MSSERSEKNTSSSKLPKRPHGLGRGLSALLGETAHEESTHAPVRTGSSVQSIEIALIHPHPEQPRRHFDDAALKELADSIAKRGVVQPIIVRPQGSTYQIVAGERRWRAAQRAQLHRIPAIVRDFDEAETLEIALVENIQREDLNPIEEADAYRKLINQFGHSQEALGQIVGKSRSHVANLMRLLELPVAVQKAVMEQRITMGHARALIGVDNCEALALAVEQKGLSVRETEVLIRKAKTGNAEARISPRRQHPVGKDADIAALEEHLADIVGLKVDIAHNEQGGGILSLRYSTLDQLDMLCQRLSGERI